MFEQDKVSWSEGPNWSLALQPSFSSSNDPEDMAYIALETQNWRIDEKYGPVDLVKSGHLGLLHFVDFVDDSSCFLSNVIPNG